ncbi:MAG: LysR family transcriptional regulator, partial [Actinotalea sp.]|nr:LysR family transcriptional regulator [Actinotalea sp.]
MDLDREALRWFVAVADELHFSRAAASLGISRTRLSRAVLDLEETLGEALFVRPSERTELTDAGRALRTRAEELLTEPAVPGEAAEPPGAPSGPVLRIAIVPGVTVAKWTRVWDERRPDLPLVVLRAEEDPAVRVLHDAEADLAFVRLPVDREGLSVIPLYAEVPVVVLGTEHELTLLDEVPVADLVDERLLLEPDAVAQWRDRWREVAGGRTAGHRPLPEAGDMAATIALVAAGVGVVVVPQSVARLHHRKDLTYRPVTDLDPTEVGLAWVAERTTPGIEDFVGVVRGRSARSSRSGSPQADAVPEP